jgi:hypothetical protein
VEEEGARAYLCVCVLLLVASQEEIDSYYCPKKRAR